MYSYGVPLSKRFMATSMATYIERYRMVLKIQPEFNNLSQSQQEKIWKENSLLAIGVIVAKMESCKTGNEQLFFAKGNEINCWINQMSDKNQLKKLTMDMANISTGVLSALELTKASAAFWVSSKALLSVNDLLDRSGSTEVVGLVLLFLSSH